MRVTAYSNLFLKIALSCTALLMDLIYTRGTLIKLVNVFSISNPNADYLACSVVFFRLKKRIFFRQEARKRVSGQKYPGMHQMYTIN